MLTRMKMPPRPSVSSRGDRSEARRRAQADLELLLQRIGRPPEMARPTARPGGFTATRRPAPAVPPPSKHEAMPRPARPSAVPATPSSPAAVPHKAAVRNGMAAIATLLGAVVVAWLVFSQLATSSGMEKIATTVLAHAGRIAGLEERQAELSATTLRRLAEMNVTLAEVRYPPTAFAEAQDLFKVGRYAEAEAAYHAFLLRSPDSRLADKALHNAAVAAAMRNNCSMADSYLRQLRNRFPTSPLVVSSRDLVAMCGKLRSR